MEQFFEKPSKQNPKYNCIIVTSSSVKYDISSVFLQLELNRKKDQIAQCVRLKCINVAYNNTHLNSLIKVRDRIYIYAHDGEISDEVFRGFIWNIRYNSRTEKELTLTCYDNLIYFQESEDNRYFTSGKSSETICQILCDSWNVPLEYTYQSITHDVMPLKGALSDIFLSQILEKVRKQTGKRYVMYSEKDIVKISPAGENEKIYQIQRNENAISTESQVTMDGIITKIVILGKTDDNGQNHIEATVCGDIKSYGTLQKIKNKEEKTELENIQKEAKETIKEKGTPSRSYEVVAIDIPWLKLGDKIRVVAGDMFGIFLITGISHNISNSEKIMTLTLEDWLEA